MYVCLSVGLCGMNVQTVGPGVPKLGMGLDGYLGDNLGQVSSASGSQGASGLREKGRGVSLGEKEREIKRETDGSLRFLGRGFDPWTGRLFIFVSKTFISNVCILSSSTCSWIPGRSWALSYFFKMDRSNFDDKHYVTQPMNDVGL